MPLVLRLLGRFELTTGKDAPLAISGSRAKVFLARLALSVGGVDRSILGTMLWGDRAEAQARASLRQMVWTIREALGDRADLVLAEAAVLRLDPAAVTVDVTEFERLALALEPDEAERALRLYRGELLEGIDLIALAPDGYLLRERRRLHDLALQATTALVEAFGRSGRLDAAVRAARRGLEIDPYHEALHSALVKLLHRLGRHHEARDQDEAFRERMRSELGVTVPPVVALATAAGVLPEVVAGAAPVTNAAGAVWQSGGVKLAGGVALLVLVAGLWLSGAHDPAPAPAPAATAAAVTAPTRNLEAFDHFMRAEAQELWAADADLIRDMLAAYGRSIALDPDYADAQAGYARVAVEIWLRGLGEIMPGSVARLRAYEAAGRALDRDPGNARALVVLSRIQAREGALESALVTARQAVAARPADVEASANLALVLSYGGSSVAARAELVRLRHLMQAVTPDLMLVFGQIAFADVRYADASGDFVTAWPDLPKDELLLTHLTASLALQGRSTQALMTRTRLVALRPAANLHYYAAQYGYRGAEQNRRFLEGLRRAGIPDWPHGFQGEEADRLTGAALMAVAVGTQWEGVLGDGRAFVRTSDAAGTFTLQMGAARVGGHQTVKADALCQDLPDRAVPGDICGRVYRVKGPGDSDTGLAFVTLDEVAYFSVSKRAKGVD